MIEPLEIGNAVLYRGDCLDVLGQIPAYSVKAIVTDLPYGINTKSDGNGKLSPWGDLCNSAFWYAEWFRRAREKLTPDGCMWTCLNWRSLVTFQKAACDVGWSIESLLVWDKRWIGPGGPKGLRPSYELVALFAAENFAIPDRGLPDIQPFPWSSNKPNGHPAEKPVALMDFLVRNSTAPGDLVMDLFMGSGTTGIAALASGRRFIGVEQDPGFFDIACNRIRSEATPTSLFDQSDLSA